MVGTTGTGIGKLMKYLYLNIVKFLTAMVALLGASVAQIAVPLLIAKVLDCLKTADMHQIGIYCLYMAGITLFSAISVWYRAYSFNVISERIAVMLRYDLFLAVINKDVGFFDTEKTGDILSRIVNDTSVI